MWKMWFSFLQWIHFSYQSYLIYLLTDLPIIQQYGYQLWSPFIFWWYTRGLLWKTHGVDRFDSLCWPLSCFTTHCFYLLTLDCSFFIILWERDHNYSSIYQLTFNFQNPSLEYCQGFKQCVVECSYGNSAKQGLIRGFHGILLSKNLFL